MRFGVPIGYALSIVFLFLFFLCVATDDWPLAKQFLMTTGLSLALFSVSIPHSPERAVKAVQTFDRWRTGTYEFRKQNILDHTGAALVPLIVFAVALFGLIDMVTFSSFLHLQPTSWLRVKPVWLLTALTSGFVLYVQLRRMGGGNIWQGTIVWLLATAQLFLPLIGVWSLALGLKFAFNDPSLQARDMLFIGVSPSARAAEAISIGLPLFGLASIAISFFCWRLRHSLNVQGKPWILSRLLARARSSREPVC